MMTATLPRIAIVACSKSKLSVEMAPARMLYCGKLFRLARDYAECYCDDYRILSAQYNVVRPDVEIRTYDRSLASLSRHEREDWAEFCVSQIHRQWPHGSARFVLLGGALYGEALRGLAHVERPLAHMGIGKQIAWLRDQVERGTAARV